MWTAIAIGYVATLGLFLVGWARWQKRMAEYDKAMAKSLIQSTQRHL